MHLIIMMIIFVGLAAIIVWVADWTNEGHGLRLAALHINAAIHFEEEEPGGARSFISTYCRVAIDPNMSMCGGVRSRLRISSKNHA